MGMSLADMKRLLDSPGLSSVALDGAAVTVSDTTADPNGPFKALWIGVTGNVKVTSPGGNAVVYTNVPVGVLPVACSFVWSTGTTVTTPGTNIIGLK